MLRIVIVLLLSLMIMSCSQIFDAKTDIQQGTAITQNQIDAINIGMSKYQVKKILGSPTIQDPFHNNRWDYINNSKISGSKQLLQLTVIFNDNNELIDIINSFKDI